nr:hypothetical protein [Xylella taiwanensis]
MTSVHTARKLALRASLYSFTAVTISSFGLLIMDVKYACGATLTGFAATLGTWLAGYIALGGGAQRGVAVMTRLMLAMLLKWVFLITALLLGFGLWRLPALGLLSGMAIGLFFQVLVITRRQS